jgi:hypothetical protein
MGEVRNAYKILFGKPERKRLGGKRGRRRGDNIRLDLRKIVEWIYLALDTDQWRALVKTIMMLRVT